MQEIKQRRGFGQATVTTYPQKITFGEMRASGTHDVLIYCRDHRCSHHVETNADGWADDVRLSDIEPIFTCTRCGEGAQRCGRSFRRPGMGCSMTDVGVRVDAVTYDHRLFRHDWHCLFRLPDLRAVEAGED
jgi:hypothetical protein